MIFHEYATQWHFETNRPRHPAVGPLVTPKQETVLTREFLCGTVAVVFEIDPERLASSSRGPARVALARQVYPALTTLRQPLSAMAQRATEALIVHSRGNSPLKGEEVFPASLRVKALLGNLRFASASMDSLISTPWLANSIKRPVPHPMLKPASSFCSQRFIHTASC